MDKLYLGSGKMERMISMRITDDMLRRIAYIQYKYLITGRSEVMRRSAEIGMEIMRLAANDDLEKITVTVDVQTGSVTPA